jgi:hypothetical protein
MTTAIHGRLEGSLAVGRWYSDLSKRREERCDDARKERLYIYDRPSLRSTILNPSLVLVKRASKCNEDETVVGETVDRTPEGTPGEYDIMIPGEGTRQWQMLYTTNVLKPRKQNVTAQ